MWGPGWVFTFPWLCFIPCRSVSLLSEGTMTFFPSCLVQYFEWTANEAWPFVSLLLRLGWGVCHPSLLQPSLPPNWGNFLHNDASFLEKDNGLAHHQTHLLLLTSVLVLSRSLGWHRPWHRYFAPLSWLPVTRLCVLVTGNWFLSSYSLLPVKSCRISVPRTLALGFRMLL